MARLLLAVYAALTAYATLYPMEGWRDAGISAFAYLSAPWPRFVTNFDLAVNVLGYAPFGFLAVAALHPRVRGVPAFATATAAGFALALALEALQSYLPARIASNLDALCNLAGAAAGAALGLRYVPRLLVEGPIGRRRVSIISDLVGQVRCLDGAITAVKKGPFHRVAQLANIAGPVRCSAEFQRFLSRRHY